MKLKRYWILITGLLSKRNMIILGVFINLVGLMGPWIHFSQYDKRSMYYFYMNPLYLFVKIVPTDLNLSPTQCTNFFYRVDSSFLGTSNIIGSILLLIGILTFKKKLCWTGLILIFLSLLLFPTILPIIFSDTTPCWGIILTVIGFAIIIISLCIEFILFRYDMGFPRR